MLEPIPFAGFIEIPDELTDEEIIKIALESYDGSSYLVNQDKPRFHNIIVFARAILRKAQEK